jgi:tRNA pseudouridine32 synthase/23S rRNA pseudouridine746 synthase
MLSRLRLKKIDPLPATILDHLIAYFPHVSEAEWRERVRSGKVMLENGSPVDESTPWRIDLLVLYSREVRDEKPFAGREAIVYRDENIIVVDKPHGIPVVPSGAVVNESLLRRLIASTGIEEISPVHRLDRETAGLVVFAIRRESRGAYQKLFADRRIEREYLAVAPVENEPTVRRWSVSNRLDVEEPWFRMRIVDGEPNAGTEIELIELRNGRGLFRLRPLTGKKHQLRIHMASIGYPIENDPYYPVLLDDRYDLDPPMQLLASGLRFLDPVSGREMDFRSGLALGF